jgi:hypothetical protein
MFASPSVACGGARTMSLELARVGLVVALSLVGYNQVRTVVDKTSNLIEECIDVLVIDLFPTSKRDPQGIDEAIRDEIEEEAFGLPADKPLVLAACEADLSPEAYVEPIAVVEVLPDMPIFLEEDSYVPVPLTASYQTAWNDFPTALNGRLETPPSNPPGNL